MAGAGNLYRSMGFRFATVCLKDARSGQYRARSPLAKPCAAQIGFVLPEERGARPVPPRDGKRRRPDDLRRQRTPRSAPAAGLAPQPCCRTRAASSCCRWWWAGCSSACSTPTAYRPRRKACRPTKTSLIKALKSQVLLALGNS
jgi:hypothetical protein